MNIKKLFGVLFISVMLLTIPCAYATDDSSDNTEFNIIQDVNNIFIISLIEESSDIISMCNSDFKENERLESAIKRFKRAVPREGVRIEVRKREHYEKPSVKRKKKAEAARKRAR